MDKSACFPYRRCGVCSAIEEHSLECNMFADIRHRPKIASLLRCVSAPRTLAKVANADVRVVLIDFELSIMSIIAMRFLLRLRAYVYPDVNTVWLSQLNLELNTTSKLSRRKCRPDVDEKDGLRNVWDEILLRSTTWGHQLLIT